MSFAFQLTKPAQLVSEESLNSTANPKLLTQPRTTHHIRSTGTLSPFKSPSVQSFHREQMVNTSARLFISPGGRSSRRTPSEAICGLKGELVALKDEISKLLTDEDRKRLMERQHKASVMPSPRYQRPQRDTDISVNSQKCEPLESSFLVQPGEEITPEKARLLATENETLRADLRVLKLKYVTRKAELKDRNSALQQKIANLQEIISTNETDVAAYKSDIESQLEMLRKMSALNPERLTEQNHQLQQEVGRLTTELQVKQQQLVSQQSQALKKISAELNQARSDLQLSLNEIGQLRAQGTRFRSELDKAIQNGLEKQQKIDQLSPQAEQSEHLKSTIRRLENQITQEASRAITQANSELHQLRSQFDVLQLQHLSTRKELVRATQLSEVKQQELAIASKQAAECQHLKEQLARLNQLYQQSRVDHIDLQQTRSQNSTMRNEIQRLNAIVNSLKHSEAEANMLVNRQNELLREQLDRLNTILSTCQNEYESLTAKYYQEVNKASNRDAESSSSQAYYKGEYNRMKKSLTAEEAEVIQLSNTHRHQVEKLSDTINSQREELLSLQGKLQESEKFTAALQSRNKMLESKDDSSVMNSLRLDIERLNHRLREKQDEATSLVESHARREDSLNRIIERLQSQPVVQIDVFNEQSSRLQSQQIENINLRSEVQNLHGELSAMKENSRQTQRLVEQLNKRSDQYEQQISHLKATHNRQLEELSQSMDERSQIDRLCAIIQQLNGKLQLRDEDMNNLRRDKESANFKWQELSARSGKASRQIEELEDKLEASQEEIQKLKISKRHVENQLAMQTDTVKTLEARLNEKEYDSTVLVKEQVIRQQQSQLIQLEGQLQLQKDTVAELNQQMLLLRQHQERLQTDLRMRTQQLESQRDELIHLEQSNRHKLNQLTSERERWKLSERNGEQSKIINMLEQQLKKQEQDYQHIIRGLKKELQDSRRGDASLMSTNAGMAQLDEALRGQFGQLNEVKKELQKKNSDAYRLKDQLDAMRSDFDNLRSQLQMQKLKYLSQKNNAQMAFDIERQNLRNELLSEKRVNESIGQKLKYLNEENKKKDGFIQTYIVGKKLSQDDKFMLKEFFEQFSLDFPKEGLMEVMYAERKLITELESTNRRLQDELHTLRTR